MTHPERPDEAVVEELLGPLREDEAAPPRGLEDATLRKVRATITLRELVDLTTAVFVLRFCAPLLDLIAAMTGAELPGDDAPLL